MRYTIHTDVPYVKNPHKTKLPSRKRILMVLAGMMSLFAYGEVFTWSGGSSVCSFSDSTYWSGGSADYPGENDYFLHGNTRYYFDLGGNTYTIGGLANGYNSPYNQQTLTIENGTLVVKHSFSNRVFRVIAKDTGHFKFGPDSCSELGDGGAGVNLYDIRNGGAVTFNGTVIAARFVVVVSSGGTFTFNPSSFYFLSTAYDIAVQAITNSGTAYFPSGVTLNGDCSSTKPPSTFTIRQNAGTMTLGGPLVRNGTYGKLCFSLAGGTLAATSDVSFTGLDVVTMEAGCTATVNVDAGSTLDLSAMTFGANAALTKSGAGIVNVGTSLPDVLTVASGSVRVTSGVALGSRLSLNSGTTLVLAGVGISADAIGGIADVAVVLDDAVVSLVDGTPVFSSGDAALLASIAAKLTLPAGWRAAVNGGAVCVYSTTDTRASFMSSGEVSLTSSACWTGGVPAAGDDVVVRGEDTVAVLDADTPAYASVTVQEGATLKVAGSPASLPPVSLQYDAHIVFAEHSEVTLPPIAGYATAGTMPTVEISTNATVHVEDDGYKMTNVNLRLFGMLDIKQDFWFGWADSGSTTFFNLLADGATISNRTNASYFRFLCPETGGTVRAPEKMVFRRTIFRPKTADPSRFRTWVGYGNPDTVQFTLEVDDCFFELRGNTAMYIGGAATIACVNGGGVKKTEYFAHPGLYMDLYIIDKARLTFDGESYFIYTFNRNPVRVEPTDDGHETFVFRDGSWIGVHTLIGNGRAVATFEDSWWDVLQRCAYSDIGVAGVTDNSGWMNDAFHGLKSVNVPTGKFVGIRSVDYWPWGENWNREIILDPAVPITGGGSLLVTNASPGWSMRAIVACGSNTATGEAWACPSADGCQLLFADGANWAGTLVGGENIAFTNLTAGASPATVTVGAIRFDGNLSPRVWRTGGTNDYLRITGALSGNGGFAPVTMDGEPEAGDTYVIGEIPLAGGEAPDVSTYSTRRWKLFSVPSGNGETALLMSRYAPLSMTVSFR